MLDIATIHDANAAAETDPTRPLHPLMWIGVLVILVVIALVNGCGV
jgi:hypothetical protein